MKRGGGRRYYRPDDVFLLRGIRHLLYSEGYTNRGVQRILREQGIQFVQTVHEGAPQPGAAGADDDAPERGRGLLGLIPGFGKGHAAEDEDEAGAETDEVAEPADGVDGSAGALPGERREPVFGPAPARAQQPAAGLSREQAVQLQMALDSLGECRRLLDEALKES
jgi:DNA-binding transcriptional MerR regulator